MKSTLFMLLVLAISTVQAQENHQIHATESVDTAPQADNSFRNPHAFADGWRLDALPFHTHSEDSLSSLLVDRVENVSSENSHAMTYDVQAWWGNTANKVLVRAEGNVQGGASQNARTELLWSHAASAFWDSHLGLRYDSGAGVQRTWLAMGIQGIAPYWVYVEATGYVNEQGRAALRAEFEYDVLLTQRLIMQPRFEANFYSRDDAAARLSAGLAAIELGLRLRYEITPQIAPYLGFDWDYSPHYFKNYQTNTASVVAGVHFWF